MYRFYLPSCGFFSSAVLIVPLLTSLLTMTTFLHHLSDRNNSHQPPFIFVQAAALAPPAPFEIIANLTPPIEAGNFYGSAVIDAPNDAAFFGNTGNPGRIYKYNISADNFSYVSRLVAPADEFWFRAAVIDAPNAVAYFGSGNNPGKVCKVNIGPTNFSFDTCIAATSGGANDFRTAVIDLTNYLAYFSTFTGPSRVCKYDVSLTNFSFVSCIQASGGSSLFGSATIDLTNYLAYFGSDTVPGRVCKYDVSPTNFAFIDCIAGPGGADKFYSAVLNLQDNFGYFGTLTDPGQICRFNIAPTNFSFDSCIEAPTGVNRLSSVVYDEPNSAAYYGTENGPAKICRFILSSANFSFDSCIDPPGDTVNFRRPTVIDPDRKIAIFCSNVGDARLLKISFGEPLIPKTKTRTLKSLTATATNYSVSRSVTKLSVTATHTNYSKSQTTTAVPPLTLSRSASKTEIDNATTTIITTTATTTTTTNNPTAPNTTTIATTTTTSSTQPSSSSATGTTVTLLAVKTYASIPANLTQFPSFTPPATTLANGQIRLDEISGKQSIDEILNVLTNSQTNSNSTPPTEVSMKAADPNLGTFTIREENLPASVTITKNTDDEIAFSSVSLRDLAIAIRNGYVFSLSPEAEARNLTEGQYVEVIAKDSGDQSGTTALQLKQIEINLGPAAIYPRSRNATFNIPRGKRFVIDLNSTFLHRQQLKMSFAAHQADLFPLPGLVRLSCDLLGNCTIRGIIETEDPIVIEVQASDGFILSASYVTIVPVIIAIYPNPTVDLLPLLLRPGQDFVYSLPNNLFVSSSEIEYTAVRLASGFPLPSTMVFDPPFFLRGSYNQEGLLHLQVRASDLFADSVRNFTLNFTNVQPFCRNDFSTTFDVNTNASIPNVRPIAALQPFERTIEFKEVCVDNDNDPLRFDVNAFELPSWLRFVVQPGGISTLPQSLRLSGTPPRSAENSLLLVNVSVTDLFSSLILSIPLQIEKNQPPALIRPLPNYTINPGESYRESIDLAQHFEDANSDDLIISTRILTDYASTWMQTSIDSNNVLYITMAPKDDITGEAGDAQNADERLLVRVEDPLGNFTTTIINVYVRLTTWQEIRTCVYVGSALLSLLVSIISTILLYPIVVNFFRSGSKVILCPLNARNRVWKMPEDGKTIDIQNRIKDDCCMSGRNATKCISNWLYNQLTLERFTFGDPPNWVEKLDDGLRLVVKNEPRTDDQVLKNPTRSSCYVRVYNRRGIILVEFEMIYREVVKDWTFDHDIHEDHQPKTSRALSKQIVTPHQQNETREEPAFVAFREPPKIETRRFSRSDSFLDFNNNNNNNKVQESRTINIGSDDGDDAVEMMNHRGEPRGNNNDYKTNNTHAPSSASQGYAAPTGLQQKRYSVDDLL